ncbi:MAG TPA: transcription termination factor Rho, partial [Blastocatellia bacterium]|nr:transcription termination factor Rho [Blastocatellia bacterium]
MNQTQAASGVLQLAEKGFGFLRQASQNYLPSQKDVFVPRSMIERLRLREGLYVSGSARPGAPRRGRPPGVELVAVDSINDLSHEQYARVREFSELTSVDPIERL